MWVKGWNLTNTGLAFSKHGDLISGKKYLEKGSSLLKESGDSFSYACSLVPYSQNSHLMGDYEEASRLVAECQQLLEEKKEQLFYTYTLSTSGRLAAEYGALDEAEARHIDCLLQRKKLDYQSAISYTLSDLGTVAYLKGEYEKARGYFQESILLANELNLPYTTSRSLWGLGNLAVAEGDYTLAARFFQESGLTNIRMIGGPGWAALGLNKWKEAEQYFRSCLQIMLEKGNKPLGLDALVGVAHLSAQTGAFMDALELLVLVQLHPASNYEIMRKAKKLWAKLTAELPSENILLAETKGSDINLWAAAEKVLDALRMTS